MTSPIAHYLETKDGIVEHLLAEHLAGVAELAQAFCEPFDARRWGFLGGILHDIGKYQAAFQWYIRDSNGRRGSVQHSPAGAWEAFQSKWMPLWFVILGHHGQLPAKGRHLEADWKKRGQGIHAAAISGGWIRPALDEPVAMPAWMVDLKGSQRHYAYECFVRMLFSALVDADWLDTEAFTQPDQTRQRNDGDSIDVLQERLRGHLAELQSRAAATSVNACRAAILQQCLEAASGDPGAYDLTVPTGGGKTLASMAFALEHAATHGLSRVIVAIPYTSIIEQNPLCQHRRDTCLLVY